jgi:hypothetical protein
MTWHSALLVVGGSLIINWAAFELFPTGVAGYYISLLGSMLWGYFIGRTS